jgi:hypothetical protein
MSKFSVDPLKENSIMYLYAIRDEIDFTPTYQRQSDIWPISKRLLLIDSLLNGFDIPKMYFHEVSKRKGDQTIRYAVIDGKQRLETIFQFLDGKYPVANDFQDMSGVFGEFTGKYYKEFGQISLKLKARFESLPLPIFIVRTNDIELIEEMFSRLNEASPLNAAEKRNAFGGPIPSLIRDLSNHNFFTNKVPFNNKRYRHYDIIAKLLLFADRGKVVDTKKIHLDRFVKSFIGNTVDSTQSIKSKTDETLNSMDMIFNNNDTLLKLVTMVPVYFGLFMVLLSGNKFDILSRDTLLRFEQEKRRNRELAQNDEENDNINYDWLEFDRLTQSPNDSSSIEFKINILLNYLGVDEIANKSLHLPPRTSAP